MHNSNTTTHNPQLYTTPNTIIMYTIGLFDRPNNGSLTNNVTSDTNNNLARRIAAAAAVLLKNDNGTTGTPLLPLPTTADTRIAVIGSCASSSPLVHGTGSGEVRVVLVV